jgi:putative intracellular protease/amidase
VVGNFSIRSGASSSLTGGTLKSKNQIIKADQQYSFKRVCWISAMTGTKELRIGVFIPVGAQLLDLSPIDLFSMITPDYLRACTLPTPIVNLGTPCTIHYISMPGNEHIEMTAQAFLRISKTTEDKEVQPGMLDTLLVPGPDPSTIFDAKVLDFVRAHAIWRGSDGKLVDILSVCTGCILLGQSEVLKGKKASGPRAIVPKLRKDFPDTTWIDDKRWVKDGNIWTSGKQATTSTNFYTSEVL